MANTPFGSGTSLMEDLNGPDNSMQQVNSGLSALSLTPAMPKGVIQKPEASSMSSALNVNGSFSSFVPREKTPYYPSSPMSPVFRHQRIPQMVQAQSLGEDTHGGLAPMNNSFAASPVIHSKHTLSSLNNAPGSSSLDVQNSSQYFPANSHQHQDPLSSFLPPPPNLDASDASHQLGRLDNTGLFLSKNDNNQPKSPFVTTPRNNRGNSFNDAALTRERSLSSPGNFLRRQSLGAPSPGPSGQILYEDKPLSWNEQSVFPSTPCSRHREASALPSPKNADRLNCRPPRHCGDNKDTMQALLSPRIQVRHTASDGCFNFPSAIPLANNMSPVANNNHGLPPSNNPSNVIGSPSFDSSVRGGNGNDRGSMDALNSNVNFLQYQISHTTMPSGISNNNSGAIQQDNNCYVQQPPMPIPLGLQRHNSTGSQHFLVNERGEIVGHASPVITHNTLGGLAQGGEPRITFPPIPQRSNSYGSQPVGSFNHIQSQQGQGPPPQIFNPIPFQSERANNTEENNHIGSIGDGRVHNRHNTEPIAPTTIFNQNTGGIVHTRHPVSATSDVFEQALAGENIEGIDLLRGGSEGSSGLGGSLDEKASNQSYASKLMMPCPQPAVDHTKGRASSQLLTAGANLAKSGPRMIYNIKFKRSQRNFVIGQRVTREIKIGCYVKVEADRGEDLGIVMSIVPMEKFLLSHRHKSLTEDSIGSSGGDPPSPTQSANIGDLKRIMRVATHDEISLLEVKREEEEELLKICRTKVRQRGLPMTVVDAEYQFDRNKLTFFFQAEGRIDFRELVRDLFSMYKTRIWMQQLDKNGSPDEVDGNQAEE